MISKNYRILLVVFCFCCSFIQLDETKQLIIHAKYDYFTADNLGSIYFIREDELVKHLASGKFFARYSNLKLGSITTIDATNPLKLVLYYRDFQQIVFLDNQLSLNSQAVSLEKLGYEQTDLVCASANNSFWIFEKQNNELLRFNENLKKIAFTGNLKQVLQSDLSPNFMIEHNGYLYLNCPKTGIYVFDVFGAFSKIIALKNLRQFQVDERIIYYQKDSAFCSYDHALFEDACKALPGKLKPESMKYSNHKLYSGFKDSLMVMNF